MADPDSLTFTSFGGLGEIGLNCTLLSTDKGMLLIDCGLMFPEDHHLGVDVVIPRFDHIVQNRERLKGVILTHGHEDHIGALPWFLPLMPATLYGSPFTLALVEHRLREHGLLEQASLVPVAPAQRLELAGIGVCFFPVSHSIVQGYALGLETPAGRMFYTGDFKIDKNGDPGWSTDIAAISEFAGKDGVLALFSDSTNVENKGHSLSEATVHERFRHIFSNAPGRIIITLFASNIRRIQTIFDLAEKFGRKVAVDGRSLINNIEMARSIGLLRIPPGVYRDVSAMPMLAENEQVLLVTGSQGEPLSVLSRIAANEYKKLQITNGDTVVMSSRIIPGNSRAISKLINNLYKLGAEVLYDALEEIHASGHAHQDELRAMLKAVRPKYFVPIHGEYRHLVKHARLAEECGVEKDNILILTNGMPVTFWPHGIRFEEPVPVDSILVDGKGVGDVGHFLLRERHILGDVGFVVVMLVVDEKTWAVLHGPELLSKGFVFEQHYSHILEDAKTLVLDILEEMPPGDTPKLTERIRTALRRFFRSALGRDPVVVPLVATV